MVDARHARWAEALDEASGQPEIPADRTPVRRPQTGNGDELGQVFAELRQESAPLGGLMRNGAPVQPEARPLDLLPRQALPGQTLGKTPWLGMAVHRGGSGSLDVPAGAQGEQPGGGPLRATLAEALPARFDGVGVQAVDAEVASLQRALSSDAQPAGRPVPVEATESSNARPVASSSVGDPAADVSADPSTGEESPGSDDQARTARPKATAKPVGTQRSVGTPGSQSAPLGQAAAAAPGSEAQRLPEGATVTRVSTTTPATVSSGRSVEAQMFQQNVAVDMHRVELDVQDGEDRLRVTLAREIDGLAVEVRSPRELVAELRALRPEVEQAFAEEGHDLAAFDAEEDPTLEREAEEEADSWSEAATAGTTDPTPASEQTAHDGLLSREA